MRLRQYKGQTSQAHNISFFVAKTDAGRFIKEMWFNIDYTCEDQTTQLSGWGFGLGKHLSITDGAFSIHEVDQTLAPHVAGDLGRLSGQGTLTLSFPAFTPDEHAAVVHDRRSDVGGGVPPNDSPRTRSTPPPVTSYAPPSLGTHAPDELERRLQERLDALGPARRAELLHVLMLPDFERADRIGEFWGYPKSRTFAELLIDCEEDRTLRAVLVGMLREAERSGPSWDPTGGARAARRAGDRRRIAEGPVRRPALRATAFLSRFFVLLTLTYLSLTFFTGLICEVDPAWLVAVTVQV